MKVLVKIAKQIYLSNKSNKVDEIAIKIAIELNILYENACKIVDCFNKSDDNVSHLMCNETTLMYQTVYDNS